MSDSLRPHESQHARPPRPSPTPRVHPDSRPSSQWCHPAISSSVVPFSSCPQSLPASESFPMSQLFTILWQQRVKHSFLRGNIKPLLMKVNSTLVHSCGLVADTVINILIFKSEKKKQSYEKCNANTQTCNMKKHLKEFCRFSQSDYLWNIIVEVLLCKYWFSK